MLLCEVFWEYNFQIFNSSVNALEDRQTFEEGQKVSPAGETCDEQAQVNNVSR